MHRVAKLHDIGSDPIAILHLFCLQMLNLIIKHGQSLLIQLLCLLLLCQQSLFQLLLLCKPCLQMANLRLFLLLPLVFPRDRLFQLPYRYLLHPYRMLQLQRLLLEKQVRVSCVIQLLSEQQNFLF